MTLKEYFRNHEEYRCRDGGGRFTSYEKTAKKFAEKLVREYGGILKRIFDDPVAFAKAILNFHPFPYQEKILRDSSKRLISICGRQIGKSTCSAVKLIHFAVTHPRTTSIIVSHTLRQSMETFEKVMGFVGSSILENSVVRATRTQIKFSNGSRILCLPSGRYGSTLRGLTVHFAVVDEAAFIYDEVITQVVFPMLATTDGYIWMLTTPWDKEHITYTCFTSKDWSVYHLPSSVSPLIKPEWLEAQRLLYRTRGREEYFRMEYLGEFIDDVNAYFPMTLLRPCLIDVETDEVYKIMHGERGDLYAGYDPGGKQDYAAFAVVGRIGERRYLRYWRQELYPEEVPNPYTLFTVDVVKEQFDRESYVKVLIDDTGLGRPVVEHAVDLGLPAEGITLTKKPREEVLATLKFFLEQRLILLPNHPDVVGSLNCIQYERTRTGGYRFYHRLGTHDDLAYAIALACYASKEEAKPLGVVVKI
ncbi:MAG: phage terminase large subunit [Candidatus Geothermarchaeales archaeon]